MKINSGFWRKMEMIFYKPKKENLKSGSRIEFWQDLETVKANFFR